MQPLMRSDDEGPELARFGVVTGGRPLTLNSERKDRWGARAATAEWKVAAGWALKEHRLHRHRFEAVVFEFTPTYVKGPMPDTANIYPTEKAIVDAVVDAGMIPDDNRWHNRGHLSRPPEVGEFTGVLVTIWPAAAPAHECGCRSVFDRSQRGNQLRAARR
jgi:hypothetical protein